MNAWLLVVALLWAQDPEIVAPEGAPPEPPADTATSAPPPPVLLEPPPVVGQSTVITVRDEFERAAPGATVQVVHRPGLDGERQMAVGITDSRGRVEWVPEVAGVTSVRAGEHTVPVAVASAGVPTGTATVLGLLLLAGLGFTAWGLAARRPRRRS